ncbi:DUF6771 family protein [Sphingobium xenophagum]|uniref:DUF6771 family protein n=1 Tax=Sphingobium xenophagum TaxID=121428 RepID=UPI00345E194C
MNQPDSLWLAQSLLHAPGWARVALTAPNERLLCNDKFGSRVTTNEMAGFHGSKRKR